MKPGLNGLFLAAVISLTAAMAQQTNAPAPSTQQSGETQKKQVLYFVLARDENGKATKGVTIDCNKLTADNRLTLDFLKQFCVEGHVASWNADAGQQTNPMLLRAAIIHVLNDKQTWTPEKFRKVLEACNVAEVSRKYVPETIVTNAPPPAPTQ